jgi:hypothetical protein
MLTIVRNRTWAFDATIYDTYVGEGDPGNVPTNHTGWTIRSQIRKKIGNVLVANLNVTFPVPVSGTIAIRHERDFTRSLATGDYWWDIVATDAAGDDYVYVEPEPIAVRDNPTDPANATYSFVPGGGGVISHTHLISDVTGLQTALSGKQPIDADLTAIAALTTTANGRALLTSANALTIGASASVSGTNTGDQDLSGLVPRLSTLTVTGTTPAFDPLVEQGDLYNGRRIWENGDGGTLLYDGTSWYLTQLDPDGTIVYEAYNTSGSYEPWKLTGWVLNEGSGQPSFTIDPPVLLPVNASGTIALTSRMDGQPDKLTGGTISGATAFASGATFTYAGTSASDHRIALGAGTTGATLFSAATAAAARTTLELATANSPTFAGITASGTVTASTSGNGLALHGGGTVTGASGAITITPTAGSTLSIATNSTGTVAIAGTKTASSETSAALTVAGGVGIASGGLRVSGTTNISGAFSATTITTGFTFNGTEIATPATPAANAYKIYADDNGAGKTRLMVLFATGAAQQIAIEP